MEKTLFVYLLVASTFLLRLIAMYFKIDLWGPRRKQSNDVDLHG